MAEFTMHFCGHYGTVFEGGDTQRTLYEACTQDEQPVCPYGIGESERDRCGCWGCRLYLTGWRRGDEPTKAARWVDGRNLAAQTPVYGGGIAEGTLQTNRIACGTSVREDFIFGLSAVIQAISATSAASVFGVVSPISGSITAVSTTPTSSIIGFMWLYSATIAAVSTTPAAVLGFIFEMAASMDIASTTPDTPDLIKGRHFDDALILAASTTPDTVDLPVARNMLATLAAACTTPDTPILAVEREYAATLAPASSTPDTVALDCWELFSAILAAASTTPDTVALAVQREYAAAIDVAATTPDDVDLTIS